MFSKLIVLAATLGLASAACPNQCSGHGTCGSSEVCTCYDNWGMGGVAGGDCSERFCPYELAWVDAPTVGGLVHQYAECAAKGVCDRDSGECACLAGYTGKACARQICPDDCSGHGTCEYMNELLYATVYNDFSNGLGVGAQQPTIATHWDTQRARACVCDSAWSGINCGSKICPHGNDFLDTRLNRVNAEVKQKQRIVLVEAIEIDSVDGGKILGTAVPAHPALVGGVFALTFTSRLNEQFTTVPITVTAAADYTTVMAPAIKTALQNLPNKVIDVVNVVVSSNAAALSTGGAVTGVAIDKGLVIEIEFAGDANHGKQNLIEVSSLACGAGCTPQIAGLKNLVQWGLANTKSFVDQLVVADFNTYECGRRGKCDTDTGICACFEGFTGESCTEITALV